MQGDVQNKDSFWNTLKIQYRMTLFLELIQIRIVYKTEAYRS